MNAEPNFTAAERELPDGMLDYEARCAIRNLIRLYGFEMARDMIAGFLIDELNRRTIDV
jgi:hypothetical protein